MFDFSTISVLLYLIYPIILIAISVYISLTREMNSDTYFFANRNTNWFILGISFLTSSLFGPYILGLIPSGSTLGLPYIYGIISVIMLSILGWFLAPKLLDANINTIPEFFERRFNKACRLYVSGLYIVSNIFFRLLIILIIGSILFQIVNGLDAYFSLIFLIVITGIFLIIGGLYAELYVNVFQISIIVLGVTGFVIWMFYKGANAYSEINSFDLTSLKNWDANYNLDISGILIGLPIIGFWFWCIDQFIVQKLLSGKNLNSIRKASLIAAVFQIIPVVLFMLPAFFVPVFLPHITAMEFVGLLFNDGFLPVYIKSGLLIAVVAVIITTFSNVINSTSMLFTFDFYKSMRPNTSDRKLVLIGRLTIMVLLLISFLLIPFSQTAGFRLCINLFGLFCYVIVLLSAVFIAGLFWKKIKSESAFLTLVLGTITIIVKGFFEISFNTNSFSNSLFNWFKYLDFLQFSIFIFFITIVSLHLFNRFRWLSQSFIITKKIFNQSITKFKYSVHKKDFLVLPILVFTSILVDSKILL